MSDVIPIAKPEFITVTVSVPAALLAPLIEALKAAQFEAIRKGLAGPGERRL